MFYPELVRPDNVMRSGIVQPFNVVSQSPVTQARHEIDPFINAIRPKGSMIQGSVMSGAGFGGGGGGFGIVSPEVIRSLGTSTPPTVDEQLKKLKRDRWIWGGIGIGLGLVAAIVGYRVL